MFGGLLNRLKGKFVRKEVMAIKDKLDTPEEQAAFKEGLVKKGMSPHFATFLAFMAPIVLEVLSSADPSLLFSDPLTFGRVLLTGVVVRLVMQAAPPGTVITVTPAPKDKKE